MSDPNVYVCGGRMQLLFRAVARTDGGEVVTELVPHRALWDGQPVSEVVAEALAITWYEAQDATEGDGNAP